MMGESPWYRRPPAWIDGGTKSWPSVYIGISGRHARGVAEVVLEGALGEGGTRRRLDRHQTHRGVATNGSAIPPRLDPPPQLPITTSGRSSPASASCSLASSPMTVWCSSTWLSTEPSE